MPSPVGSKVGGGSSPGVEVGGPTVVGTVVTVVGGAVVTGGGGTRMVEVVVDSSGGTVGTVSLTVVLTPAPKASTHQVPVPSACRPAHVSP